ncbi:MAG TPA: UDP-N-acetylmuramoyl-L-alanyl-D-glutamate--2,6-diaminopimelate ligase, partial [Elusimicrobia bacterium]|nr:UDP-N-acetylmuramoyl-L-alanyl-D-glutamate--2,6-diaminopimelate ligase [Elusimicrobiota bacterium]
MPRLRPPGPHDAGPPGRAAARAPACPSARDGQGGESVTLQEVLRGASGARIVGDAQAAIEGVAHDSRSVRPGWLFFALPGAKTDGNRHVKDALERGAAALMS